MRLFGAREIASGLGNLSRPKQPLPMWSRVVGDAIDLAFLAWAFKTKRTHTERLVGAFVAVLGVTALDAFTGAKLQSEKQPQPPERKVLAVTINRPLHEVSQRWQEVAGDIAEKGNVSFKHAPGGRAPRFGSRSRAVASQARGRSGVAHRCRAARGRRSAQGQAADRARRDHPLGRKHSPRMHAARPSVKKGA